MLLKHYYNNSYDIALDLDFTSQLTLISGDSGVGKTLFFGLMQTESSVDKRIVCIDLKSSSYDIKNFIRGFSDKLILIDNADIILGSKERRYISTDKKNQYIIFGRNSLGLGINQDNCGRFMLVGNKVILKYPFK